MSAEPVQSASQEHSVAEDWSDSRQPASRDTRLDLLRGLCLVLMTVDHLPTNPLFRFTNHTLGIVSAAEGFVFISGMVSGWVFGRSLNKQGPEIMRKHIFLRVRDIYLTQLFLYTAILVLGLNAGAPGVATRSFWANWWRGALFIERPSLLSILPMYCIFLSITPLVLRQLAIARGWFVFLPSLGLWLAAQFGLGSPQGHFSWLQLGLFNLFAWQLLFVAGVYFGYQRCSGRQSRLSQSRLLFVISVIVGLLFFLIRHPGRLFGHSALLNMDIALQSWKGILHPLRLINFAALAFILSYLPRSMDRFVETFRPFRVLRFLGRHSLQVFAWSVALRYLACSVSGWASLAPLMKMLLVILAAASLLIPAWLHECVQDFKKRRASQELSLSGASAA